MKPYKVKVRFNDDDRQTLKNVVRVDIYPHSSMYQCTHKDGAQTFISGKDVKSITFGKNVNIDE
ncbi:TPA: hypothetical protein R1902_000188 [Staphylococcus delphini]|nr:hypothetical protein [Staphylococcus delphini]HEC2147718.1 hypothetical protein [Staphylococcus delphini]HEC2150309.1 hypothetical protein [Staphylococcus delphini]HEC2159225.1 hypothetical protein [Staphylococcus delphini]HEC2168274.1 hypothetical protein [Staphylococcus delphini]